MKKLALTIFLILIIVLLIWFLLCEIDRKQGRNIVPGYYYYAGMNALTGPMNLFLGRFTRHPDDNSPFPDMERNFPQHCLLKDNWKNIRDEVLDLYAREDMKSIKGDMFFDKIIPDGSTWKKFYIKWHSDILPDAKEKLPYTSALIAALPCVKIAMISVLKPGAVILPHIGPMSACARYHLCLQEGGPLCAIKVDGIKYSWKDGEDVLFDDTYVHEVRNDSNQTRVILFCDIEREYKGIFAPVLKDLMVYFSKLTSREN